jgi:hypothetical protein
VTVEDAQRDLLVSLTAPLPDPLAGYVFGIALIATDYLLKLVP